MWPAAPPSLRIIASLRLSLIILSSIGKSSFFNFSKYSLSNLSSTKPDSSIGMYAVLKESKSSLRISILTIVEDTGDSAYISVLPVYIRGSGFTGKKITLTPGVKYFCPSANFLTKSSALLISPPFDDVPIAYIPSPNSFWPVILYTVPIGDGSGETIACTFGFFAYILSKNHLEVFGSKPSFDILEITIVNSTS